MKRFVSSFVLCGALCVAGAQNTSTTPGASGQTLSGVLMDASCAAIPGSRSSASLQTYSANSPSSTEAVQNSTTSTSSVTHSGRSSPTEGIRNNSASTTGTTGTADAAARAQDERNRTGGANSSSVTQTASSSVTERATTSAGATSGASSASALGTTGAATDVGGTGERSRSAGSGSTGATVREKYAQCMPTASTTSFALHANGQLYVLDQASNDMVRQQMSGEAFRGAMTEPGGQSKWMTVTVVGTPGAGNNLSITSVRK